MKNCNSKRFVYTAIAIIILIALAILIYLGSDTGWTHYTP